MSTSRLQRMDAVINDYIAKGLNDLDTKSPLKRDAIFRNASQTKAIASIGLMMLFEEGKFLLDEPISKYIPAFKNSKVLDKFNEKDSSYTTVPATREITSRQLLTHTSGISYPGIGTKEAVALYAKNKIPSSIGTPDGTLADAINRLSVLPLLHQPGEKWTYGYLIEVLPGQSLDQFLCTHPFDPLGINDTYFYLPTAKRNRLAMVYVEDERKAIRPLPSLRDYPKKAGTCYSGGAGLSSTMYDYIFRYYLLG